MQLYPQDVSRFLPVCQPAPEMTALLIVIFIWSIAWKGAALWKAARNNQMYWFVALLAVNTIGILEILYIYVFAKKKPESGSSSGIAR